MQSHFEITPTQRTHRPTRDPFVAFTTREHEVLALMSEGWSNRAIAEQLFVGPGTIEKHIRSIYLKLSLDPDDAGHRRVQAVLAFLRREQANWKGSQSHPV